MESSRDVRKTPQTLTLFPHFQKKHALATASSPRSPFAPGIFVPLGPGEHRAFSRSESRTAGSEMNRAASRRRAS